MRVSVTLPLRVGTLHAVLVVHSLENEVVFRNCYVDCFEGSCVVGLGFPASRGDCDDEIMGVRVL